MNENTERTQVPPLPVLSPPPAAASGKQPSIVRDARIVNLLGLGICVIGVLGMMAVLFGEVETADNQAGAVFGILVYVCFGALNLWLARGHKRGNPAAWSVQRFVSVLCLLGFPLGTLIHALLLSKWFKPETKAWFGLK